MKHSKFDVDYTTNDLDTVNFESSGYGEGISSILDASLSFGGDWDAGANPYDNPPGIYPRDDLPNLRFYTNVSDGQNWLFTYARLRSARNGSEVRGKVTFEASGMNQGSFTAPSGSV